MSIPEWIVEQFDDPDPRERNRSDRRFALFVWLPATVVYVAWKVWQFIGG